MLLLDKLKSIYQYISYMGYSWFFFRLKYEILKKINYFDYINNKILKKVNNVSRGLHIYENISLVNKEYISDSSFIEKANNAIDNKIYSFSNEYLDYSDGLKINWHKNPKTKVSSNSNIFWNKLPDFGKYGDIKLIWEASRFPQIYFFINAYSITKDKKYAESCVYQIIDWINNNSFPYGVNYKCGQEITFRILNWIVVLEYFDDFISEVNKKLIVENIYISLLRINANIDYAAKSVKNNHSISEAAGLFIGGLLFPQYKESKKLQKKGLKYLLKETEYQVYKDGSYIQHSFTYQRLALDVLSFVILVAKKKNYVLPKAILDRHFKMIFFLNSFIQDSGKLPNYGSNDGANLFPLSSNDYKDFKPNLNFAILLNNKKKLFSDSYSIANFFNINLNENIEDLTKEISFKDGGYYILKNKDVFSFIRCHSYRHRPASNDMFHLDIWYKGQNLFCDTGSFSYNTEKTFKNNFIGTIGHNTILINGSNQMTQVLNFGWSNWTKAECINSDSNNFLGKNYAYKEKFGIIQEREVSLEKNTITVIDSIKNIKSMTSIKQIWNTKYHVEIIDKYTLKINGYIVFSNVELKVETSYISEYYNSYFEGNRIIFYIDTDKDIEIKTVMEFK
ncbi:heparinase II/III family protein [Arcobacter sp. LA11]|uniref:heparinase II/III family protein n=1 Tax=Arcobacter sp. LA11 TaxID=1898176 RepID=UPI0009333A73|nr:heparinase II/III family protein [Arcobacter sp. LA11]